MALIVTISLAAASDLGSVGDSRLGFPGFFISPSSMNRGFEKPFLSRRLLFEDKGFSFVRCVVLC
jgi:hypothetical protein